MTDYTPTTIDATDAWTHISTQTLAAPATAITVSGIDATAGTHLRGLLYVVKDGNSGSIAITLNNDTGANYIRQYIRSRTTDTVESAGATGQTSLTYPDTIDANGYGIYYFTWLKPVAGKLARSFGISASQTTDLRVSNTVGTWENLSALISRIDITTGASGFIANTRFVLEGRTS